MRFQGAGFDSRRRSRFACVHCASRRAFDAVRLRKKRLLRACRDNRLCLRAQCWQSHAGSGVRTLVGLRRGVYAAVKVAFGACAFAVRGGACIFFRYLRRLQQPEIDCGGSVLRGFLLHTRQNSRISQSGFRQHQGKILPAPHSQPSARKPKSKAF